MTAQRREPPAHEEISFSDPDSVAAGLERLRPRLERMLVMRIDPRLARRIGIDDLIQEAFVEALNRLDEYLERSSLPFFLWVRLLTGQKLLQAQRHHIGTSKRDATRERSPVPFPSASTVSMTHARIDSAATPSKIALRKETSLQLQAALEALDPEDREVLALLYFERLSFEETAAALQLSYSGARKRHTRALRKLRAELGDLTGLMEVLTR